MFRLRTMNQAQEFSTRMTRALEVEMVLERLRQARIFALVTILSRLSTLNPVNTPNQVKTHNRFQDQLKATLYLVLRASDHKNTKANDRIPGDYSEGVSDWVQGDKKVYG